MGLDVTAYRRLERVADWPEGVEDIDDVARYDFDQGTYIWNGRRVVEVHPWGQGDFPEHHNLTPGLYAYADKTGWRAGSYSGYNDWRDWLSRAALGVSAETVWRDFDRWRDRGAAWLVNFSDCEGIIGAEVCARILADLRENESMIREQTFGPEAEWHLAKLDAWLAGLEMAADGGMLDFH
jgi:hypothetical protein